MPLKVKNIAAGFFRDGVFHPIRASRDYDPSLVEEAKQYAKITPRQKERKAKQAEAIAIAARKAAARAGKAELAPSAKKKTVGKAAAKSSISGKRAKLLSRKSKAKKNPIPSNRWVPAKVRRTKSGDIKLLLPL